MQRSGEPRLGTRCRFARNPAAADAPRCGLAAERANELARTGAHVAQELTHISQSRTELGIAYLDWHHRVLELGEHGISFGNRNDGAVDEPSNPGRWEARIRRSKPSAR